MKFERIVELSYVLEPGHETRLFSIKRIPVKDYGKMFPHYVPSKDDPNYPMYMIQMVSHIGTHIEVPYHYKLRGNDLSEVPIDQLVGEALILDLTDVRPKEEISLEKVKKAAKGIRKGDIIFCKTGFGRGDKILVRSGPRKERLFEAPFFSVDAIRWLIGKGMKLFGVETEMEDLLAGSNVNHYDLFSNGIPLVENLTNLDRLKKNRVNVFILPPRIRKLEGFPVRVIAIE